MLNNVTENYIRDIIDKWKNLNTVVVVYDSNFKMKEFIQMFFVIKCKINKKSEINNLMIMNELLLVE